jgi:hypothetical protein
MKEAEHIDAWKRKNIDKQRRIKILGWFFLGVALTCSSFAFFSSSDHAWNFMLASAEEQEGYYMLSVLLTMLGLFCLNSLKKPI